MSKPGLVMFRALTRSSSLDALRQTIIQCSRDGLVSEVIALADQIPLTDQDPMTLNAIVRAHCRLGNPRRGLDALKERKTRTDTIYTNCA